MRDQLQANSAAGPLGVMGDEREEQPDILGSEHVVPRAELPALIEAAVERVLASCSSTSGTTSEWGMSRPPRSRGLHAGRIQYGGNRGKKHTHLQGRAILPHSAGPFPLLIRAA